MSEMTDAVARRLADDASLYVAVEEDDDGLVLTGIVATDEQRQIAMEIAGDVAPDRNIQDNLEVSEAQPAQSGGLAISETEVAGFAGAEPDTLEQDAIEPGDLQDRGALHDPLAASGAGAAELGADTVAEGDEAYVPPIDPVGTNRSVIGGYELSADDLIASMDEHPRGDEEMADNARLALAADSATAGLTIDVEVSGGRARLRGRVPTIDDGDLAADVVSRIPGIVDVSDETEPEAGRYL